MCREDVDWTRKAAAGEQRDEALEDARGSLVMKLLIGNCSYQRFKWRAPDPRSQRTGADRFKELPHDGLDVREMYDCGGGAPHRFTARVATVGPSWRKRQHH